MEYPVVIEKGDKSFSGYTLDIEGIYAFGDSEGEVLEKLGQAISDRIAECRGAGAAIPRPSHVVKTVTV